MDIPESGHYYHIYNRGINSTNLFIQEKNYLFFLNKYALHLSDYVDTYAYCLLRNHFHLLIRVNDDDIIKELTAGRNFHKEGLHSTDHVISKQFAKLFSSYTQSINKVYNRTGSLFETPFKRKRITSDKYLTRIITYIHQNPQKHGFVDNFRDYPFSSYYSFLSSHKTKLARKEVMEWFGSEEYFINHHLTIEGDNADFIIEM